MTIYRLPSGKGVGSLETDLSRTMELDGTSYDLRFRWNTRDEAWTFICSKSGGGVIFSTKCPTGRVLNSLYKHREGCPQGELVVVDMSDELGRLDYDNFTIAGRFRLLYNSVT